MSVYVLYTDPPVPPEKWRERRRRRCSVVADTGEELRAFLYQYLHRSDVQGSGGISISDADEIGERSHCIAGDTDRLIEAGVCTQITAREWEAIQQARRVARRLAGIA